MVGSDEEFLRHRTFLTLMEQTLEALTFAAIDLLMPAFQVTDEERARFRAPKLEIDERRARYDAANNCIKLRPTDIDQPAVIGEEVAHYIHEQLNPCSEELTETFASLPVITSSEMVGRYGALSYMKRRGLTPDVWRNHVVYTDNAVDTVDHLGHEFGYKRAYKLFELHGERYLARLARMGVDESLDFACRAAPISLYELYIMPVIDTAFRRHMRIQS
jgi:hypothetical protein